MSWFGGDSATQGSLATTSKNVAPVSRTVLSTSDSASADIPAPPEPPNQGCFPCPAEGTQAMFRTYCQALRTPHHSSQRACSLRKRLNERGEASWIYMSSAARTLGRTRRSSKQLLSSR